MEKRYEYRVDIAHLPVGVDPATAKRNDYRYVGLVDRTPWTEETIAAFLKAKKAEAAGGALNGTRIVVRRALVPEGKESNPFGRFALYARWQLDAAGKARPFKGQ